MLRDPFANATGKTLTEYINKVRIDNAKQMLRCSSLPINSITFYVGFRDANDFSRLFKKLEGISPEDYRSLK
mgnify:CR=1 FL=1